MHELAITEGLVDAVTERLPGGEVTCVRLEIGALSGVVADSVRFCFDLVTEGTNLEGASAGDLRAARACATAGSAAASSSRTGRSCCARAAAPT